MELFSADIVWGLAIRAHDINNGYYKEIVLDETDLTVKHVPNKILVKSWLQQKQEPTEDEIARGRQCRDHFKGYLFKQIASDITSFESEALVLASIDQFNSTQLTAFSFISCLPEVANRDNRRDDLLELVMQSQQLVGDISDKVVGDASIITCVYIPQYTRYKIVARFGESYVDFWYRNELTVNQTYHISGKIKSFRADKTTQLNYVKLA